MLQTLENSTSHKGTITGIESAKQEKSRKVLENEAALNKLSGEINGLLLTAGNPSKYIVIGQIPFTNQENFLREKITSMLKIGSIAQVKVTLANVLKEMPNKQATFKKFNTLIHNILEESIQKRQVENAKIAREMEQKLRAKPKMIDSSIARNFATPREIKERL